MNSLTKASFECTAGQRELENYQLAREAAREGMVLLKNDGALPFAARRLALYGAGASMTVKGGTGSGEVNERKSLSVLEGLEEAGFEIGTKKWIADFEEGYRAEEAAYKLEKRKRVNVLKLSSIMDMLFDNFRAGAGRPITEEDVAESATDSCLYVLRRQAGEGGDRRVEKGDFLLSDEEVEHIRFCAARYDRFVLVINSGGIVELSALEGIEGINAILYLSQPGSAGGLALADIISGAAAPSGKLSDTWPRHYDDLPFARDYGSLNGQTDREYYKEGIYVGYRYFDSFGAEPQWPFGFGLGYTDFALRCSGVSLEGQTVTVKAAVVNRGGTHSGKEVAQLYVSPPAGAFPKARQSLAAFEKTRLLPPGEGETLPLVFDMAALGSYREADAAFVLEKGDYILRLGTSSRNTEPVGIVTLPEEIILSRHEHICPAEEPMQELAAPAGTENLPEGLPRLSLDPGVFETTVYEYAPPAPCEDERVKAFMKGLPVKDMAELVVGIGMFGGEKRFDLPGSVGNTSSKFWDRGLVNMPLCDGPAGLRIQKRSVLDEKGKIRPLELPLSVFESFPAFVKNLMMGDEKKGRVLYQFTTAFPVATALAQSWNRELMHEVGCAIQREMEEYGCVYWLAPAVNIHRNPLCGRNFEYFSEDPLLAGLMAAALTRGVQSKPGYYVTVKHFACNNQEDNRNFVSSVVSERALREIYLRPFELCVREGGARGIMTAYNKVNGVYAPNSHDLCTKALRNEWGFAGVVMTDWFSTNPGQADTALCMSAGNDLVMPGGGSFKKAILKGVKTGKIREADLRRCCANVLLAAFDSALQREYFP